MSTRFYKKYTNQIAGTKLINILDTSFSPPQKLVITTCAIVEASCSLIFSLCKENFIDACKFNFFTIAQRQLCFACASERGACDTESMAETISAALFPDSSQDEELKIKQ